MKWLIIRSAGKGAEMTEPEWIKKLQELSVLYNQQRAHRDFQANEVYKFVEWIHQQYGYSYTKPDLTNKNHE